MYYLKNTDMQEPRAIYKAPKMSRFYRGTFTGLSGKYQGMKVYTCKRLSTILSLRESVHDYCDEWFDVYNENGKIAIPASEASHAET